VAVSEVSNQKTIQEIIESSSKKTETRNTGELGKDDFLKLLVTQLRYQDPLEPMEDKEFISQMAQFSSLEQMQNLNTSFSSVKAFSLIGKRITASITDESTGELKIVEGDVTAVKISGGKVFAVVNGQDVPVDSVTNVTESYWNLTSNIAAYTNLIGFNAKGAVYDSQTGDIVYVNGKVSAIQKGLYEDYAVMDGVSVNIAEIVTNSPSADPDFMKDYLESHKGQQVSVVIMDESTGKKVAVTAKLREYEIKDNKVTAILDGVYVPVDSITKITPAQTAESSSEE